VLQLCSYSYSCTRRLLALDLYASAITGRPLEFVTDSSVSTFFLLLHNPTLRDLSTCFDIRTYIHLTLFTGYTHSCTYLPTIMAFSALPTYLDPSLDLEVLVPPAFILLGPTSKGSTPSVHDCLSPRLTLPSKSTFTSPCLSRTRPHYSPCEQRHSPRFRARDNLHERQRTLPSL
jgi:hypothetical protein